MKLNFDDENLVTLMQWMVQQFQQDGVVYQRNAELDFGAMVDAGQCLFDSPNAFDLGAYRELEYDFGLVPFPKKDEGQAEYITYAQPYVVSVPYVPVTNAGKDSVHDRYPDGRHGGIWLRKGAACDLRSGDHAEEHP